MIVIIDYGMGNIRSAQRGFEHVGADVRVIQSPSEVGDARAIVVPGDGAFGKAMENLRAAGWVEPLRDWVARGKPLLGICVGMQLLFESSEESRDIAALAKVDDANSREAIAHEGAAKGLGILCGTVKRFDNGLKIPQMGWNQLTIRQSNPLLRDVPNASYVYFVHSYYCAPSDAGVTLATTDYGIDFASIVGRENVWGVQFHPEKSHAVGLKMVENFVEIVKQ